MDIDHLATLARISVPAEAKEKLSKDLESILAYISELESVKGLSLGGEPILPKDELRNVFRKDIDAYEPRTFTEDILREAPKKEDGFFVVKKILEK